MIDNLAVLLAIRDHLLTLQVAATGATRLAATETGYTRSSGSFAADGFRAGMEVTPVGFANNDPGVVGYVTDLTLTIRGGRAADAEQDGRSLTVGLPADRSWENKEYTPQAGRWFVEEDYIPGPSVGVGFHEQETFPAYVLRLYGLSGTGVGALYKVSDAILKLFAPALSLPLADGNVARVRTDPAPYKSQLKRDDVNHSLIVITIPFWVRTMNILS